MTLPLTPETLAAAYDYLRTTPPYQNFNLQDSEDVKFKVGRQKNKFATYRWNGKQHEVTMSAGCIGQTSTLFKSMGHEMIHMHLEEVGIESKGNENVHNGAFRKYAAQACRYHGWDLKEFY